MYIYDIFGIRNIPSFFEQSQKKAIKLVEIAILCGQWSILGNFNKEPRSSSLGKQADRTSFWPAH